MLWGPIASTIGMVLQTHPQVAWPLVRDHLRSVQVAFLAGEVHKRQADGPEPDGEHLMTIAERFQRAGAEGDGAEGEGEAGTDSSVRLSYLLKVRFPCLACR